MLNLAIKNFDVISSRNYLEIDEILISKLNSVLPEDLDSVIGRKGHRYQDDSTKLALYLARKLCKFTEDSYNDKLGVVCCTEFGNFGNGLLINESALDIDSILSAQLFPNATFSSTAVTVSLALKARGVNLTMNSGQLGILNAINLIDRYIKNNRLEECVLICVDEFHPFTASQVPVPKKSAMHFSSGISVFHMKSDSTCPSSIKLKDSILTDNSDEFLSFISKCDCPVISWKNIEHFDEKESRVNYLDCYSGVNQIPILMKLAKRHMAIKGLKSILVVDESHSGGFGGLLLERGL
ncbi:hypothetical protein L1D11_09180 [Vibrio sp. Isolate32]|uniref:hypothetical protein n=2 Tax=unclassified Vibrio TaxID=2614977 RepID=UPI001EFED96C|nr:hypothetical protein [Vibrio sp. Isolate32]MCG9553549.1 hypothetical protein [Vibrio sp. Isolate32]